MRFAIHSLLSTLYLLGMHLAFCEKIKYLGLYIIGGKSFKVDTRTMRRNFFASVIGILSECSKASVISNICLCGTHYLSILMYVLEGINLSNSHCNAIISRWISGYRFFFKF